LPAELDTLRDVMERIRQENPAYWPFGLDPGQLDGGAWLVREKRSGTPVGFVGMQERLKAGRHIGYYAVGMLPEHRRKGYAKEALASLLDTRAPEFDEYRAWIQETNGPSLGLADSLGVRKEIFKQAALSPTERTRRYNRRHPDKVRSYLRKTQDDRVERNRAHREATSRHGETYMKDKDVHHPQGPKGDKPPTRVVKEDHGPDKRAGLLKLAMQAPAAVSRLARLKARLALPGGRLAAGMGAGSLYGYGESKLFDLDPTSTKINVLLSSLLGGGIGLAGRARGKLITPKYGLATELVTTNVPKMLAIVGVDRLDKFRDAQQGLVDRRLEAATIDRDAAKDRARASKYLAPAIVALAGAGGLGALAARRQAREATNMRVLKQLEPSRSDRLTIDIPREFVSEEFYKRLGREVLFDTPESKVQKAEAQLERYRPSTHGRAVPYTPQVGGWRP